MHEYSILAAFREDFKTAICCGDVAIVSSIINRARNFSSDGQIVIELYQDDAIFAAIQIAHKDSRLAVIKLLCDAAWRYCQVNYGAGVQAKFNGWIGAHDFAGKTVLHRSVELGDGYSTFKQLLRCRVPSDLVNNAGLTFLALAEEWERAGIEEAIAAVDREFAPAELVIPMATPESGTFNGAAAAA